MPEEPRTFVQCSKCGRGVWSTDVNTTGRCNECAGPSPSTRTAADDDKEPKPKD
jgi:hypothetical protein